MTLVIPRQIPWVVSQPKRQGFTLIELLVVIAIIGLLTSILMPSLIKAKKLAKRVACAGNLYALGKAAAFYQSDFGQYVPICWRNWDDSYVNPWKSWRMGLLPYASGEDAFNCPAAEDFGTVGEVFHSEDELASVTERAGTANSGSYGVMYQFALPSYRAINFHGIKDLAHTHWNLAFSTIPGIAWRDPINSVYIADGCLTEGPITYPTKSYKDYGTSFILPPSDPRYFGIGLTRRFADRHMGTNCLFLDGRVESFLTADLDSMIAGEGGCIWDVE